MDKTAQPSARQGFEILLVICRALGITVIFGFPSALKNKGGACFYYNYKNKSARIYLPKYYKTRFRHKNNAILMHEMGHYFSFVNNKIITSPHPLIGSWLILIEEVTAWHIAINLANVLNLPVDASFKHYMKMGLNSYLQRLYKSTEYSIVNLLYPLKEVMEKKHG